MNQKYIGAILIIVGIVFSVTLYTLYQNEQETLKLFTEEEGTCFLEDGTCLHEKNNTLFFIPSVLSVAIIILGIYLVGFDKTQKILSEQNLKVSSALEAVKKEDTEKDKFNHFLSAFNEEEQLILKAVKEQEGITQSTLRYKTGLSKTRLSLILASLEERGIVSREDSGKTKKVFIRSRV
jgi:uncharacterized membrane protein